MIRWAITAVLLLLASSVSANPYEEAMHTVRVLSDSSCVRLLKFGKSHCERDIPAFVISNFTTSAQDKARILICSGQHGDETDPVKSVLSLCKNLSAGSEPDLLKRCAIIVVPMVNPDGVANGRRVNGVDADTNRDWSAMTTRETLYVNSIIKAWKPNLLIDVHNWNEPSSIPGNAIEVPSTGDGDRDSAMVAIARQAGHSSGLALVECHPYSDKRLFHRHYCSLGYAAYLLETKGAEPYETRDRIYKTAIKSLITSIVQNRSGRYVMSPASMQFRPDYVSAYIDPIQNKSTGASSIMSAFMLTIACVIVAFLMRPFARGEQGAWSRRYTMCAVDPEIGSERILHRHAPCPITARSWVNRRLRSRYTPADPEDDKDAPNAAAAPQTAGYARAS
ncbi:DUF2817 domain-containing protein [bacterium]|nr:DUF2817 domain-containing protein [bacterium]